MIRMWGILAGSLLYMEVIYHLGCFGFTASNPIFAFAFITAIAAIQVLLTGSIPAKIRKTVMWVMFSMEYLLFASQTVYFRLFRQPLLWEAVVRGGQDAVKNYWREALAGILRTIPLLILLAVPLIVVGILIHKKKWELKALDNIQWLRTFLLGSVGLILSVMVIWIGKYIKADYYEIYEEFYDPLSVVESMGVLTMFQRDTALFLGSELSDLWLSLREQNSEPSSESMSAFGETQVNEANKNIMDQSSEAFEEAGQEGGSEESTSQLEQINYEQIKHRLPIDFDQLGALAESKEEAWLVQYMEELEPSKGNEFTGMFEGYNLIYLTAEGFSPYAVRQEVTPTLYRLIHSGFVFTNYYVPLWQTSTSDGEYINCTGLIPDGQFSMRKSSENDMAFTLPRYFAKEGVKSLAYHNNSLSYYDRYLTHTNLGYEFKAAKVGDLEEEEWQDFIFPMEHPNAWPASDLEMMQGTMEEYINKERFHVYYMTVSGHMNYDFKGNAMSGKNKDAVASLDLSENGRAYIACHIELDKALEYMLKELEAAGKLENTVICMSADHYPYGMTQQQYEELAGQPLGENLDKYRNNLILWNAGMEESSVQVDKVCGPMDILPTLLNLFGFDYDSRLYAGRDIFSEEEGLVIFNDRSFVSDTVIYSQKEKTTMWKADAAEGHKKVITASEFFSVPESKVTKVVSGNPFIASTQEEREEYIADQKQEVKKRYQFSAFLLQLDYYRDIQEALNQ